MRILSSIVLCILLLSGCATVPSNHLRGTECSSIDVFFSPNDNLEKIWIDTIKSATNRIYISCFGLSNGKIADAIIEKHKDGIKVIVCVDKLQSKVRKSHIRNFQERNIESVIKKTSTLEHNKLIVVDGKHAIIGSYNLSDSAQSQDNSLVLFINQPKYAEKIEKNFLNIYERDKD